MKFKYLYVLLFSLAILGSCQSPQSDEKEMLSVSIEPQKYFLESIVGDKYSINTVIPLGSNPESYDPSPSQMVNIGKSKLYLKIGNLGFENTWLKNININNPEMEVVDCSVGITPFEHSNIDGHDHSHPGGDPHIWSSPNTALTIAKNMYKSVVELDKSNEDYYLENYNNLKNTINKTDSIIKSYLADAPSKSFIIFHPALSYFSEEYGLTQLSIEVDGKNPTPQQLSNLIQQAKRDSIKVVFIQEEFDQKNSEVVAKEIGAKVVRINPLSYEWEEEMIKIAKAISQKYD